MYESEANNRVEALPPIPAEVISELAELKGNVSARTALPWSEHCTECVWPTCYSSCELYSPRADGKCRRFVDGMVRIECPAALNSYLLKIRFKRWGKLWTPAALRMHTADHARSIEQRDHRIGGLLQIAPLPRSLKSAITGKRYSFKKRMAQRKNGTAAVPTCFVLECYNPEERTIQLSLTMRSLNEAVKVPFQALIDLKPGFRRVRIPTEEISSVLDLNSPFSIDLIPNDVPDGTTLYFGTMDFLKEITTQPKPGAKAPGDKPKVKCVVWDLDNTLWDGILVEDGAEKLRLKPGVVEVIHELDRRGILLSIVSKNNAEEASEVLRKFQLEEYFLCPQISWQPKSEGIRAIAQELNIGTDTLLFLDDSEFELQEVKAVHAEVRTFGAASYRTLLEKEELKVPITEESRNRRKMYKTEADRRNIAEGFGQDYFAFLRHCNIQLNVRPLTDENLERVHELTQRTNQMNFSGNRYDRRVLKDILSSPYLDAYVLDCSDRFGSYGVIGFGLVDRREPRLTDLMFSCRIQSKRVEHAFLAYIIRKYIEDSGKDFYANYRKTPRNAPSGRVFADLGMIEESEIDGVLSLRFHQNQQLPEEDVVQIILKEEAPAVPA
jgi:FkbH-like protein